MTDDYDSAKLRDISKLRLARAKKTGRLLGHPTHPEADGTEKPEPAKAEPKPRARKRRVRRT